NPHITCLSEPKPGKGNAVRCGMLAAKGEYRFMADADLSMPIEEVNRFLPPQLPNYDIVIASREAPGAIRYNEPAFRHWGGAPSTPSFVCLPFPAFMIPSAALNASVRRLQRTFSANKPSPAGPSISSFSTLRNCANIRSSSFPSPGITEQKVKSTLFRDALRMALDILTIRKNALQGKYAP
ncbi:MAG: glycosyltransferase, partial [Anaerolineae bacterium]|nr:glycosyltransferase [Anaerolineae bacterium]